MRKICPGKSFMAEEIFRDCANSPMKVQHVCFGQLMFASGPRYFLDFDTTLAARHAAHVVQ